MQKGSREEKGWGVFAILCSLKGRPRGIEMVVAVLKEKKKREKVRRVSVACSKEDREPRK